MTARDTPSGRDGKKSLGLFTPLQHQNYRPSETLETNVVFTGSIPTHWLLMYIDRSGNVREMSNLPTPDFHSCAREAFASAQGLLPSEQNSLPSPHRADSLERGTHSSRSGQSKWRRTGSCKELPNVEVVETITDLEDQIRLEIGDRKKVTAFYTMAFERLQQINCRLLAKNFIKIIEPHKQVRHPYNGGRKPGGARSERRNPEDTKPDWWPRDIIHKEPDHIKKDDRVKLLVHLVQNLLPMGVTADLLEEAIGVTWRHLVPKDKADKKALILEEILRVRKIEERYLSNEIDGTFPVCVTDYDRSGRGEIESDDEGVAPQVVTPSTSFSACIQRLEASRKPSDVTSMHHNAAPLETSSSSRMSAEPSFTKLEERTPKITVTQPELFGHHRNLATISIASPLLTPTHYQLIDGSQFAENNPTTPLHAVSPAPHAQTEPSAFSTSWFPAFQQGFFSPDDYSGGAGYQMPPHMVYQPSGPYCSRQDTPETFAVPEFSRPPDYNVANMHGLPFRTASPSHPSIVQYTDS